MNGAGFPPEASARLYKTFIRPVVEYGMQLEVLQQKSMAIVQKMQNMALRSMFSAHKMASINAMHRLTQIPLIKERNQELNARFFSNLHNNKNSNIIATRVFWNGIGTRNTKSLIYKATKSPWWNRMYRISHITNRPSSHNYDEYLVMDNDTRRTFYKQSVCALDANSDNVAGSIQVDLKDPIRACLRADVLKDKHVKIAIFKWLTGGVAMHTPCKKCGAALSRTHAVACAGADQYLRWKYATTLATKPKPDNRNLIDHLLNINRTTKQYSFYLDIYTAIAKIYSICLGYQLKDNGFWTRPTEPNANGNANQGGNEQRIEQQNAPNEIDIMVQRILNPPIPDVGQYHARLDPG
jgi:hypothetical protein